jgi:membrane protease YdiL (CAAX protease family)
MLTQKAWQPEAVWRLSCAILASYLLGMVLNGLVISLWPHASNSALQLVQFVIGVTCFHGTTLVLITLFLRQHQIDWSTAFGFDSPGLGRTLWLTGIASILILVVALTLSGLAGEVMIRLGSKPEAQAAVRMVQTTESWPQQVFNGLVAIGFVPVVEELFFRGLLYPTIKQIGRPRLALWGTAILFAVVHDNWMALVPLTFVAIMLTLLYEKTGNLLAPILAHSFFNGANFLLLLNEENLSRILKWLNERI